MGIPGHVLHNATVACVRTKQSKAKIENGGEEKLKAKRKPGDSIQRQRKKSRLEEKEEEETP